MGPTGDPQPMLMKSVSDCLETFMLVSFWAVAVQSCNSLHKRADTSSAYGLTSFNTSVQLLEQLPDSWKSRCSSDCAGRQSKPSGNGTY